MNLNINYISCRLLDIKVLSIIKLQVCNIGEGVGVTCSINVVRLAAVSSAVQCYTCNLIIGACAICIYVPPVQVIQRLLSSLEYGANCSQEYQFFHNDLSTLLVIVFYVYNSACC